MLLTSSAVSFVPYRFLCTEPPDSTAPVPAGRALEERRGCEGPATQAPPPHNHPGVPSSRTHSAPHRLVAPPPAPGADPWLADYEGRCAVHYAARAGALRGLTALLGPDQPHPPPGRNACERNGPSSR